PQQVPTSAAGPHPAIPLGPMEAPPMQAQVAVEARLLAAPGPAAHPQPPRSIANAETLATPPLPAHLAVQPLASPAGPQLAPPRTPVPVGSPPRTDENGAFGPEHHADPAEVIALHQGDANAASGVREGRDVLAGWGRGPGTLQALDDDEAGAAVR